MPKLSSDSPKTAPKTTSADADPAPAVTSKAPVSSEKSRHKFFAGAVIVAAALVALSLGLVGYNRNGGMSGRTGIPVVQRGQGVIYLEGTSFTSVKQGDTVHISVSENSGTEPINAVQSAITYPSDKLKITAVDNGSAFPQEAATDMSTPGLVRFARSVRPQDPPVRGNQVVVTLEVKVLKNESPLVLKIDQDFSLLVRSTDNRNILHNRR